MTVQDSFLALWEAIEETGFDADHEGELKHCLLDLAHEAGVSDELVLGQEVE